MQEKKGNRNNTSQKMYDVWYKDYMTGMQPKNIIGYYTNENNGYITLIDKKGNSFRYRMEHEISKNQYVEE